MGWPLPGTWIWPSTMPSETMLKPLACSRSRAGELEAHAVGLGADGEFTFQEASELFPAESNRPAGRASRGSGRSLRPDRRQAARLAILRPPAGTGEGDLRPSAGLPSGRRAWSADETTGCRAPARPQSLRRLRDKRRAGPWMPDLKALPLLEEYGGLRRDRGSHRCSGRSLRPPERHVKIAALAGEGAAEIHELDGGRPGGLPTSAFAIASAGGPWRPRGRRRSPGSRGARDPAGTSWDRRISRDEIRHGRTSSATGRRPRRPSPAPPSARRRQARRRSRRPPRTGKPDRAPVHRADGRQAENVPAARHVDGARSRPARRRS